MNVAGLRGYECPQCHAQVFLRVPALIPTAAGTCVIDTRPLVRSLSLHMRVGCRARRRPL